MQRQKQWQFVLDGELKRWSEKTYEQIVAELSGECVYEVEFDDEPYQVEVSILENNEEYIHVVVSVDDGSLPASLKPLARSFVKRN
jgi:hypothetical protein